MRWVFPKNPDNVPINMDHILYFHKPKQNMPNVFLIEFVTVKDDRFAWSYDKVEDRDKEYEDVHHSLETSSWTLGRKGLPYQ